MPYWEILAMALQKNPTRPKAPTHGVSITDPSTQTKSARRTGDVIDGQFQSFRHKDGYTVYIGENGQYLRR